MKITNDTSSCINCQYGKETHDHCSWFCLSKGKAVYLKINCTQHKWESKQKYNSRITEVEGIKFHSKKEAKRYQELKMLQRIGKISYFIRQPSFDLGGGTTYKADFMVFCDSKTPQIEDVKGYETKEFKRIKKIVESLYPIKILILK